MIPIKIKTLNLIRVIKAKFQIANRNKNKLKKDEYLKGICLNIIEN